MKTRILHLIPTLSSGGAERQLVNIVGNTSPNEFTHLVCTIEEAGFYEPLVRESGYEVLPFNILGKRKWFATATKFRSVIDGYRPDLLSTWLYDANIAGRIAKLHGRLKTPIVTNLQATDYEPETISAGNWSPFKVGILRNFDNVLMRLTKPYFIACSAFVKTSFERRLGIESKRTRVIYNGVDPESLVCKPNEPGEVRRELEIPENAFVFLNVGRLDPQKNQIRLLDAFAQILPQMPNSYLVIVGIGPLEDKLKEKIAALGMSRNVRLAGRRKDIGACLEMADVFTFPSLFEGLPLALMEAMFKRLPCVVGDIEVLREMITDNQSGLLVNPRIVQEIARAMIKFYDDITLRREVGENALREAENRFSAKRAGALCEGFYRQIIEETRLSK